MLREFACDICAVVCNIIVSKLSGEEIQQIHYTPHYAYGRSIAYVLSYLNYRYQQQYHIRY